MTHPLRNPFAPGRWFYRFMKWVVSDAHRAILAIEDAVWAGGNDTTRDHVDTWLKDGGHGILRANTVGMPWWYADIVLASQRSSLPRPIDG